MGLSTYFKATIGRTSIEEVLKVLSVVSGNIYILVPRKEKSAFKDYDILKDGFPTSMHYYEEDEPDYNDGCTNGKKITLSYRIDWPLSGRYENYFDPFVRMVELMGESSYKIYSEYGDMYDKSEEFSKSGFIKNYLDAYNSYFNNCTRQMFIETLKGKMLCEELEWLNFTMNKHIVEMAKGKKEYEYFGIKFNMMLFIYWCYRNLGYTSLEELKEKFNKEESVLYRKYIDDCKKKYSSGMETVLGFLGGSSPVYNYERGLGFLLKKI